MINNVKLIESLTAMTHASQIAFAASCCERLIPNYAAFSFVENWGNVETLYNSLGKIWQFVDGFQVSQIEVDKTISLLESFMPDTEDFASIFTGLAVNSVASLIHTFKCINKINIEELILVSQLAIDSIDIYLTIVNDPHIGVHAADKAFDEWIITAPLLVSEVNKQIQDLEMIRSWGGESSNLIQILRQSSASSGIQPISRGIVARPHK